ncbi:MAG: hypothetical protein IKQ12_08605 [Prevotella sp.]|nr:hypothetical protein [Prevotella sp.]
MIEQLVAIGALCLIFLIVKLLISMAVSREQEDDDNIDLARHLDRPLDTLHPINSYEGKKELRKYLSDPEIRKRAEEKRKEYNDEKQKHEELLRKERIIKRTYSYKYENILYEIFAPYATKSKYELDGQMWEMPYHKSLDNDYVISEISRLLNVSSEEANKLFWEFEKNNMIDMDNLLDKKKSVRCCLGSLLLNDWNIITNEDMNLSKWIEQNPDRETKESVDKRRGVIKEYISFNEYIKREGDYTVEYSHPCIEIKVNNGHTLFLHESSLEIPLKNYQYRLGELMESISDKLYVDIDDNLHVLKVEQ